VRRGEGETIVGGAEVSRISCSVYVDWRYAAAHRTYEMTFVLQLAGCVGSG